MRQYLRGYVKRLVCLIKKFYNRSDVRGGTTIGPVTASRLNIPVIDMGAPLLGMHSIRELASVEDHDFTVKLFTTFFSL